MVTLEDVIRLVRGDHRCTLSQIQRAYRIDVFKALKWIEALEANDIVSKPDADGNRTVLSEDDSNSYPDDDFDNFFYNFTMKGVYDE